MNHADRIAAALAKAKAPPVPRDVPPFAAAQALGYSVEKGGKGYLNNFVYGPPDPKTGRRPYLTRCHTKGEAERVARAAAFAGATFGTDQRGQLVEGPAWCPGAYPTLHPNIRRALRNGTLGPTDLDTVERILAR